MRAHILLALVGLMLPVPCLADARPTRESLRLRCEIALAYVQELVADPDWSPMIFDDRPAVFVDFLEAGWWSEGVEAPVRVAAPDALVARLQAEEGAAAVRHCASLRLFLAAHRIAYGREAVRAQGDLPWRARVRTGIVNLSLPVTSEDGRRALLGFSHSGAGAGLELLERQSDGRWRVVARKPLAVYGRRFPRALESPAIAPPGPA